MLEMRSFLGRPSLQCGAMTINPATMSVAVNGEETALTPTEARLLYALAYYQGRIVSYEDLIASVWGDSDHYQPWHLKWHLSRVRGKVGPSCQIKGRYVGVILTANDEP